MPISAFRLHAFLFHVLGSTVMALAAMSLVFLVWYPSPLHIIAGVTAIFFIILGVDVTLGPFLTLVLANPRKKRSLFALDLSIIIVVQLAAFGYGIYTVTAGRPAWLVLTGDRFDLVAVSDLDTSKPDQVLPEFREPSWFGPQFAYVPLPDDPKERSDLIVQTMDSGMDIYQFPWLYRPFAEGKATITARAKTLDMLNRFNPPEKVEAVLADNPEADGWLPLKSRKEQQVVLVKKDEGRVVRIVELKPWD
jgi:hypothetical protein